MDFFHGQIGYNYGTIGATTERKSYRWNDTCYYGTKGCIVVVTKKNIVFVAIDRAKLLAIFFNKCYNFIYSLIFCMEETI